MTQFIEEATRNRRIKFTAPQKPRIIRINLRFCDCKRLLPPGGSRHTRQASNRAIWGFRRHRGLRCVPAPRSWHQLPKLSVLRVRRCLFAHYCRRQLYCRRTRHIVVSTIVVCFSLITSVFSSEHCWLSEHCLHFVASRLLRSSHVAVTTDEVSFTHFSSCFYPELDYKYAYI